MKAAAVAMQLPRLYLGTMTFGWTKQTSSVVDQPVATTMVQQFLQQEGEHGCCTHVDTARIYAGGDTEVLLGKVLGQLNAAKVRLGNKAHPSQPGGLSNDGIQSQLKASLDCFLQGTQIDEYYLHQPDTEHDLLESLTTLHHLIQEGKIKTIGMSNYHASEVKRAFELCHQHKLTPPKVYQGLYNPLNRLVEDELIPLLHENQCQFVAYNPLAAGLLTGKHSKQQQQKVLPGRFKDNPNYLPRFYTDVNFEAISLIQKACDSENMSMVEATFRWLLLHSALEADDGVLLGASSVPQLEENLKATETAEPLPESILLAMDQAWDLTKAQAFPYWRSYSRDTPDREA